MNGSKPNQETKALYYWWDGYFIEDQEEAELMDSINAFGGTHGITHVPEDWNREQCQQHVDGLLKGQEAA